MTINYSKLANVKIKTVKCLILAAGKGTRLSARGDSKPLVSLLGLSLIERTILTAQSCGLTEFYVVSGYNGQKVRDFLDKFSRQKNIKITHIINEEWQKENGLSVLKAKEPLDENFILLMSDHIFDDRILKELINYGTTSSVVLAVDREEALPGDTKVLEQEGKIADIGKNIEKSNCIDTGIFLCSPKIFSYIEAAVKEGKTELSHAIAKAASGLNQWRYKSSCNTFLLLCFIVILRLLPIFLFYDSFFKKKFCVF